MADEKKYLEPGTLENTRKNIGTINKEEAAQMIKVLGGEILEEKPVTSPLQFTSTASRSAKPPKPRPPRPEAVRTPAEAAMLSTMSVNRASKSAPVSNKKTSGMPNISPQDWFAVDKVMMSPEYKIKTDYGIFNFIRLLQKDGLLRIDRNFAKNTLDRHISHMEAFVTLIRTIINLSPVSYQARIRSDDNPRFRLLNKVEKWDVHTLRALHNDINLYHVQIPDIMPFIKAIYSMLVQILFLGERRVTMLLKEIYEDLSLYPDVKKPLVTATMKDTHREWLYLYSQIVKGLYPLLYCMCGGPFQNFETFFSNRAAAILKFTEKSRFDILLPEAETPIPAAYEQAEQKQEEPPPAPEEKETQEKEQKDKVRKKLVKTGIKLLDTLFPDAGFTKLETHPDMYPYFQPLFEFPDGFNLLSPENPLQVLVVLLRIMEDLFQGCRNIRFVFDSDARQRDDQDSILTVLNEWNAYREVLFDKTYCHTLRNFVTEQYTKRDFCHTQYGRAMQNKLFWFIKYHFLPLYTFDKLVLERPEHNNTYRPLHSRTDFICDFFTELAHNVDITAKTENASITGIQNPWDHYSFDIPNTVSKRLDVLLMANRTGKGMTATNINLIKYTLCICAVLDWWINDGDSPAYQCDQFKFYRISLEDGGPLFTVTLRDDQQKLFLENFKKLTAEQNKKKQT
ncbi:hypothetical protein [Treponema parvum]|uniref:hypothetical protein n=1 Tax=Treponema parvum TaxID=138851 RepID=UPI001AEC575F|nr:hypothetical protein [Treponema parvum]QTQ15362.1 hypothetical protein HXT04_00835 [Treponema parvum]